MLKSQGRLLTPSILLGTIIWASIVLPASAEPTNCVPAPPGLAGWWAGEGNAQDNLGGNNGALYGSVGFGAGKVGQAFNFDGSSGYVGIPASASLNVGVGAGFSFECWIKPTALADAQPVAEWNSGGIADPQLWISVPPPSGGGSGSIYVNLIDTAGTSHTLTTGAGIVNTNGFQYVALSYDKASGLASLYYNGAMVAAAKLGSFTPQTSFGLYLGKHDVDAGTFSFHGFIDEASLYSRALTAAEIQAIYSADGSGKCSLGTAPSITTQPAGQTVLAGATATFSVVAAGSSPLTYQWRLNGANLSGANGTALTLTNVQVAQSGSYTVQVTNRYGSATSSNAVLTVNPVLSCVPPPSGMVSWWRGEGNALDQVGGNNGVLVNGVDFDTGIVGRAFRFNGSSNSFMEVADSPTLRFTNALTIECWAKRLNASEVHVLVEKGGDWTGGQSDYEVALNDTYAGGKHFGFSFAGGWRGCAVTPDTAWHHYAVVAVSGQADPILYIDGVQKTIAYRGGAATMNLTGSTRPLHLGAHLDPQTGWVNYSSTTIDEPAFFDRALSTSEIQAFYNAGGAGKCTGLTAPFITSQPTNQTVRLGGMATFTVVAGGQAPLSYQWRLGATNIAGATGTALTLSNVQPAQAGSYSVRVTNTVGSITSSNALLVITNPPVLCTAPPPGLVGWWRGEVNALDSIGTNNGTLHNGVGFEFGGGVGWAFRFNGTNSYVEVPDSPSLRLTNELTIEFWVKRQSLQNEDYIINKGGDYTGGMLDYGVTITRAQSGNTLAFTFAGGARQSLTITDLNWHHCAVTARNGDVDPIFYVDGVQRAVTARAGSSTIKLYASTAALDIGAQIDPATGWFFYSGALIDELSLYSRSLTAAEIQAIYNADGAGKCPLGTAPSIIAQPAGQTVLAEATATFSVVAAGSSPLSYQWRLNGTNLSGASGTSLTLTNVQSAQSGNYTVQVTNLNGSATSSNAVLTVNPVLSCVPPPSGLVSWWAAEGTAADAVGTNNGVLFPGAGFAAGMVGQAFSFNGTTQCLTVPYSRSLVTTSYSVEAWVKPLAQVSDPLNQDQIIGQAYGWQLVARPGTSGISVAFLFATSKSSYQSTVSTTELPIGQFSHVVGTWDGTTLRLYINGVLSAQRVPGATPVDLGYDIYIGGSYSVAGGFAGQYFNGLIDEASYYGRALSAAEIQTLYTAGSAGKCGTPVPPSIQASPQDQAVPPGGTVSFTVIAAGTSPLSYQWHFNGAGIAGATSSALTLTNVQLASVGTYAVTVTNLYGSTNSAGATLTLLGSGACTPAPAGLVSWWKAEGTAADAVGTNNGVLFPGAGFAAGMVGQAFTFNGTTQCVTVPYSGSLVTTNYSVEAWVKPLAQVSDPLNQDQIIGQAYGWQLVARPGTSGISVAFLFATSKSSYQSVVSTTELPIGQFGHVVGTWDGTTLRLYINGVLSVQRVPGATPVDLGYDIYIGGSYSVAGGFAGQYFSGLIDEASYYSRALSASEIQGIYSAGDAGKCPVRVAPSILTQPASQAVSAGGNAVFSVTVAGTPPLSYQWQFSGTNIPGATGTSLALSNVQSAQAGNYVVRVTNAFGSIISSNALLTVVSSPSCAAPPSGLISWWRAESSASDGVDSNNGTLLNGASFASGMVGQAFSFNGSNQCVQVPHAASLVASNYSIEAWVKPLAQVSDPIDQDLIFGQTFGHCQLLARTGSTGVRLAFAFGTSHYSFYEATGTSEIPIGRFSHLAGTWDGTTLRLYVNGILNAQSTPHASPVDSGCSFYLGGFYSPTADSCGYVGQFFNGLIDEASYYNRALSSAEIQSIYNAGGAGKCPLGAAPTITRQPGSLAVHAGATAVFSVAAAGTPPLSYQWQFKGTSIAGATGTSLTLSNVQSAQAGTYAVRVTNVFGSIMSSNALLMVNRMRLQVSLNPDGTRRLHFVGNNSQSYRIEVSPDMLNWVSLGICTADAEGNVEFTDPNVAKQPLGFYRAVEQ